MTRSRESGIATELKKSTVSLPVDLYWHFQEEQSRRRVTNQVAITQAIQQWLEGPLKALAPRERLQENEHWHRLLTEILTSGDQEAISAVQQNLLVFYRLAKASASAPDATPGELSD